MQAMGATEDAQLGGNRVYGKIARNIGGGEVTENPVLQELCI